MSGFFGIGGGFLIVPGLMLAADLPIINAIGSSLVSVTAFGVTTAANYALSGLVDWPLAATLLGGGVIGGAIGAATARRLAAQRGALAIVFRGDRRRGGGLCDLARDRRARLIKRDRRRMAHGPMASRRRA